MARQKSFNATADALGGPTNAVATTGDDAADLAARGCIGIAVDTAGFVRVTLLDMTDGTYVEFWFAAGQQERMRVKRIWSTTTATKATGIKALY